MKHRSLVFIILTLFIAVTPAYCKEAEEPSRLEFYSRAVKDDYGRFYLDGGNLLRLGAVLGLSGVMANSAADREVREYYQEWSDRHSCLRGEGSRRSLYHRASPCGNRVVLRPLDPIRALGLKEPQGLCRWRASRPCHTKGDRRRAPG